MSYENVIRYLMVCSSSTYSIPNEILEQGTSLAPTTKNDTISYITSLNDNIATIVCNFNSIITVNASYHNARSFDCQIIVKESPATALLNYSVFLKPIAWTN